MTPGSFHDGGERALSRGSGCVRGAFYSEEHPVTVHRLVLCWYFSGRDNGSGYASRVKKNEEDVSACPSSLCG